MGYKSTSSKTLEHLPRLMPMYSGLLNQVKPTTIDHPKRRAHSKKAVVCVVSACANFWIGVVLMQATRTGAGTCAPPSKHWFLPSSELVALAGPYLWLRGSKQFSIDVNLRTRDVLECLLKFCSIKIPCFQQNSSLSIQYRLDAKQIQMLVDHTLIQQS